jgi:hypothetical protein
MPKLEGFTVRFQRSEYKKHSNILLFSYAVKQENIHLVFHP